MNLQALLFSTDDEAAEVLGRVLPVFDIAMDRCSDPETTKSRIQEQKFVALIVDFEKPDEAGDLLRKAKQLGTEPLSIALVPDPAKVREILSGGAQFVLYKPLSEEAAQAGLRPVAALLKRERRRAFRVPVQAAVEVMLPDKRRLDGILLDLSETGMEILTAEPMDTGSLLAFHFQVPDRALEVEARGEVAWANLNGQTGVRFLDLSESAKTELKSWLQAAANLAVAGPDEIVPHCKLTDLSLGGCYVETDAPFPERALVDLCLKTDQFEVHTEGMVRVVHPSHGMGVEFPSRTEAQRAQVTSLIDFLRQSSGTSPQLSISPKALFADPAQFEPAEKTQSSSNEEDLDDPLLDLLRRGTTLRQGDFLAELEHQRHPQDVV